MNHVSMKRKFKKLESLAFFSSSFIYIYNVIPVLFLKRKMNFLCLLKLLRRIIVNFCVDDILSFYLNLTDSYVQI